MSQAAVVLPMSNPAATQRAAGQSQRNAGAVPPPSAEEVRGQLQRMLRSRLFTASPRLSRFLSFAVEQTLQGKQSTLKEYIIGVEVFQRSEAFDPRVDAIVRVEARRLRAKVEAYYSTEGANDEVLILFARGCYFPRFARRTHANDHDWLVPGVLRDGRATGAVAQQPPSSAVSERLEKWLRFVLDATQTGLWNLNLATGRISWSMSAQELLGCPPEAPVDTVEDFLARVNEGDREPLREALTRGQESAMPFEQSFRMESADGSVRQLWMKGGPANQTQGADTQLMGVVRVAEA